LIDGRGRGRGSGSLSLYGALPIASDAGSPEMNAGALHRYLAEAVWTPTALWPGAALRWSAIDERSALATLAGPREREPRIPFPMLPATWRASIRTPAGSVSATATKPCPGKAASVRR
jgi:hypothetical protein